MNKILICEDDKNIRFLIKSILESEGYSFQILESEGVADTLSIIENEYPDIMLLDIDIIGGSIFDVLNQIKNIKSKIIFITYIEDKAIDAIKLNAVDYVLKPIKRIELVNAIEKAINLMKLDLAKNNQASNKIVINNATETFILKKEEVISLEADGSYTTINVKDKSKIISSKPLKHFEDILEAKDNFIRIHKSYIINTSFIEKIVKTDGGFVQLEGGRLVPIASSKKKLLFEKLKY